MVEAKHLTKTFAVASGKLTAVNDATFRVDDGQLVAVVGKSGSGKSTLLALLGALDASSSGEVRVDGKSVEGLSGRSLLAFRRSTIGFVFQSYTLVPNLSALENVLLPMEFAGVKAEDRKARASKLLSEVGITGDKLRRVPSRLSGGEQQRVAIARALANMPKLLLADEPTGNLDAATSTTIIELLKKLSRSEGTTVIVVTHDDGVTKHADRVLHIRDGKVS